MFKDYYVILEVAQTATVEEIKTAFRRQALKWHPDRNPGSDTTQQMQEINEAKLILCDPEGRERYDREYERFKLFQNQKKHTHWQEKSGSTRSEQENEHSTYSDFNVEDDLLRKWMENARRQAVTMAKQTIEDFKGMLTVGAKAAAKEAGNQIVNQVIIVIVILIIIGLVKACQSDNGKKTASTTVFNDDNLLNTYSLKVPSILNKTSDGRWITAKDAPHMLILNISSSSIDGKSLQNLLDALIEKDIEADKKDIYPDKSFIKKDTFFSNGFAVLADNYEKNNSKGLIPVMTYFTYAVLQDGDDVIGIRSTSLNKNYNEDIIATIKSIKRIDSVSPKLSSLNKPQKENSKAHLNELKQQGFKIFSKDNFAIKCNCNLKQDAVGIKRVRESGDKYISSFYLCPEYGLSAGADEMYNISIHDHASDCKDFSESQCNVYAHAYLQNYNKDLNQSNIKGIEGNFNGCYSLEYSLAPARIPNKVIIFFRDKKSYTLQIGAKNNLEKKFNDFKSSFTFLNQ